MKKLFTLLAVSAAAMTSQAQLNLSNGATAPDWTVTDVHGGTHTLYDITASGKSVLIDFFFTTCGPCQAAAPTVTAFYQKYGCNTSDVFVISIDTGDDNAAVLAYESQYAGANSNPSASGTQGGGDAVVSAYGPAAFPTVCIIGTDNKIKANDVWPINSVADIEGAFSGAGITITEQSCASVGVAELTAMTKFSMYPNPANNVANISFEMMESEVVVLEVYNLVGEKVSSSQINGTTGLNTFEMDLTDFESGQYLVNVIVNDVNVKSSQLQVIK